MLAIHGGGEKRASIRGPVRSDHSDSSFHNQIAVRTIRGRTKLNNVLLRAVGNDSELGAVGRQGPINERAVRGNFSEWRTFACTGVESANGVFAWRTDVIEAQLRRQLGALQVDDVFIPQNKPWSAA